MFELKSERTPLTKLSIKLEQKAKCQKLHILYIHPLPRLAEKCEILSVIGTSGEP